ncbi:MAG: AbiEi antitoxin N-terminal domain-containing protein [Pseudomonadota bacterium]
MRRLGISPALQRRYEHSGWLRSIGVGAAVRYGRAVEWQGAVHAHVGGRWPLQDGRRDERDRSHRRSAGPRPCSDRTVTET